jgi:hypothetical protein
MVSPWRLLAALALLLPLSASAGTFKFFGSVGAEGQLTPANAGSPLLHGNSGAVPYRTNSADATLFVDAGPESRAWKVHLKLRGDASDQAADRAGVGEAFVQVSPRKWLDLTAGRVIEKWGTGYAWNPTAFVSPPKNPADPSDRRSSLRGVDMLRADVFVRDTNVSLYALGHGAFAARVYRLVGGTDLSLHLRRDRNGVQQGLSAARVFGDALELHGEVARRHLLLGGQYTFRGNVNVVAELYHGGDGLSRGEWQSFRERLDLARDAGAILAANRDFVPLRMGRDYAFLRVNCPAAIDTELIAITSLRDGSVLARLTLSRKLRPNLSVYLIDTELAGRRSSEMAYVQIRRATTAGARLFF